MLRSFVRNRNRALCELRMTLRFSLSHCLSTVVCSSCGKHSRALLEIHCNYWTEKSLEIKGEATKLRGCWSERLILLKVSLTIAEAERRLIEAMGMKNSRGPTQKIFLDRSRQFPKRMLVSVPTYYTDIRVLKSRRENRTKLYVDTCTLRRQNGSLVEYLARLLHKSGCKSRAHGIKRKCERCAR